MIEWIRSPIKLLVAVVILAVTIKWLVLPGAGIAMHSGTLDADMQVIEDRMVPVDGVVVGIRGSFDRSPDRDFYNYTILYEAKVADRSQPLEAESQLIAVRVHSGSEEIPSSVPKVGTHVKLWRDPQSKFLRDWPPHSAEVSALWIGLVLLGIGVVGLVVAGILIRLAIRRPTRGSA